MLGKFQRGNGAVLLFFLIFPSSLALSLCDLLSLHLCQAERRGCCDPWCSVQWARWRQLVEAARHRLPTPTPFSMALSSPVRMRCRGTNEREARAGGEASGIDTSIIQGSVDMEMIENERAREKRGRRREIKGREGEGERER